MRHITMAVIAGLVLALTACGSPGQEEDGVASLDGSAAPGGSASEAGDVDPQAAMLEFAQCMRDNGVDMPDPQIAEDGGIIQAFGGEGERPDPVVFEEAQAACDHLMPTAIGDGPEEIDEARQQAMLDFAACMREQGLDWPDPQFDGGRMLMQSPDGLDPGEIEAAEEVCSELLGDDGPMFGTSARPADDGAGS